ncbi:putative zinc-binding metallopeptidase [Mycobacterium sp. CVI_P3]|uniref:Zinc-binding metallopeptidase n=1 Tax=Mycobacterium pinniadriaticum TaxID=2994102 RepID=A0ABT3SIJ2_9MYCO|nr:putative zinc-binding metallopeptidase [Mycobacterium pinniadriaticum]MCX2932977.1 putative zinc-binding metallopeptidase [Mycobacterium pinniadriaticum]MCX2939351.1 putative zinc-binding metallopeptidase [Mycobacterium pinniadriaticum]
MRDFICPNCGQHLAFENSVCLSCGSRLGFSLQDKAFMVIASGEDSEHGGAVDASQYQLCANLHAAECNWLVEVAPIRRLCRSCVLTRTRPSDADAVAMAAFADAEKAKRRLIAELSELKLPIVGRDEDPQYGLAFDLLSSATEQVFTGHDNGLITLDLAEGDDVHREQLRVEMDEPYRTLLGHFRHEVGHYYFYRLIESSPKYLPAFRELFGDPDADYQAALDRHYSEGAPPGWARSYVSSYATMHPAEDWAETFAHYLHIRDTLDTAAAFGFVPANATFDRKQLGPSGFDTIIDIWLPLAWSLNMVNRSMGKDDLYPFVLPVPVLEKMRFIHTVIDEVTSAPANADAAVSGQ